MLFPNWGLNNLAPVKIQGENIFLSNNALAQADREQVLLLQDQVTVFAVKTIY